MGYDNAPPFGAGRPDKMAPKLIAVVYAFIGTATGESVEVACARRTPSLAGA